MAEQSSLSTFLAKASAQLKSEVTRVFTKSGVEIKTDNDLQKAGGAEELVFTEGEDFGNEFFYSVSGVRAYDVQAPGNSSGQYVAVAPQQRCPPSELRLLKMDGVHYFRIQNILYGLTKQIPCVKVSNIYYMFPALPMMKENGSGVYVVADVRDSAKKFLALVLHPETHKDVTAALDKLFGVACSFEDRCQEANEKVVLPSEKAAPKKKDDGKGKSKFGGFMGKLKAKASAVTKKVVDKVKEDERFQKGMEKAKSIVEDVKKDPRIQEGLQKSKEAARKSKVAAAQMVAEAKVVVAGMQEDAKAGRLGKVVGDAVDKSGAVAAGGIKATGKVLGKALRGAGTIMKGQLKQGEKHLSASSKAKIQRAKVYSSAGVGVTRKMASAALAVAQALGGEIRKVVDERTEGKLTEEQRRAMDQGKAFAKGAISGAMRILDAMTEAGAALIVDASAATGDVLEHTHGKDYGRAAREGGEIASNVYQSAVNMRSIGVTAIAKKSILASTKDSIGGC